MIAMSVAWLCVVLPVFCCGYVTGAFYARYAKTKELEARLTAIGPEQGYASHWCDFYYTCDRCDLYLNHDHKGSLYCPSCDSAATPSDNRDSQ